MFLALRFYRTLLICVTWLLPWLAFNLGYWIWWLLCKYFGRTPYYSLTGHIGLVLLCTFVWAFMAERYHVAGVDELFRERTGARAAMSAVLATGMIWLAILFFSRD